MERTKTFVNGGRIYPADVNAIEDRAAEMLEGTQGALPGSHFAGRFYRTTDTKMLYLDDGAEWDLVGKLSIVSRSSEHTVSDGELTEMTVAGTVNLPEAPAKNSIYGVFALGGEVTIKTLKGEKINGDFLAEAATSCKLTKFQHVAFQYDGTRYLIVAGTPTNENVYSSLVERTSGTEYEPSATRPVFVYLNCFELTSTLTLIVGEKEIDKFGSGGKASFLCSPKVKWRATFSSGTVRSSYLTL